MEMPMRAFLGTFPLEDGCSWRHGCAGGLSLSHQPGVLWGAENGEMGALTEPGEDVSLLGMGRRQQGASLCGKEVCCPLLPEDERQDLAFVLPPPPPVTPLPPGPRSLHLASRPLWFPVSSGCSLRS